MGRLSRLPREERVGTSGSRLNTLTRGSEKGTASSGHTAADERGVLRGSWGVRQSLRPPDGRDRISWRVVVRACLLSTQPPTET